ncbi:hypothetical protein C0J52_19141 [Blattella germanica]|nr:hypothetical protein C0J52_19141 [Blattella germanica]
MFSVLAVLLMAVANIMCGSPSPSPFWGIPGPVLVYQRPLEAMVDVTNDLGISVLQFWLFCTKEQGESQRDRSTTRSGYPGTGKSPGSVSGISTDTCV